MGLTISSNKIETSFECGYLTFGFFRNKIAKALDAEFGEHYATLSNYENTKDNYESFNKKTKEILERKNLDVRVVDFLFQPDSKGSIRPRQCKSLAELIKKSKENFVLSYGAYIKPNEKELIVSFLEECYSKKTWMKWS
jgi:hypothetical protein